MHFFFGGGLSTDLPVHFDLTTKTPTWKRIVLYEREFRVVAEMLCGVDDVDAILIRVRISILENEMAYNREMEKMLVAFKKRALWPDYFLMDDKSLIEQTLAKRKRTFFPFFIGVHV